MKILKIVVNGLPHVKDELNIDFVAQQRVDTYDKEHLFNVFSNIYFAFFVQICIDKRK